MILKQTTTSISEVNTAVAKMSSTTAADNSNNIVKPIYQWVNVNGMPTRMSYCGLSPEEISNNSHLKKLVLCICGNPGLTEFYEKFIQKIHQSLRVPVWVISHAGKIFYF